LSFVNDLALDRTAFAFPPIAGCKQHTRLREAVDPIFAIASVKLMSRRLATAGNAMNADNQD
jgi:hypothetical protein